MRNSVSLIVLAVAIGFAAPARAFQNATCNGQLKGKVTTVRNFFFDNNAATNYRADFIVAKDEWNRLPHMNDMFDTVFTCGGFCYAENDHFNDIRIQDLGAGGNVAFTLNWTVPCQSPFDANNDGHLDSTDFTFNTSAATTFGAPASDLDTRLFVRGVAMHEIGHMLGMLHENFGMTLMNGSGSGPGVNVHGHYPGPNALQMHPNDTAFAVQFYGNGVTTSDNAPSNFRFNSSTARIFLASPPGTTIQNCPNQTISIKWSIGNKGTTDHLNPQPAYKIFLSFKTFIDGTAILAKTSTFGSFHAQFSDFTDWFVIPSTAQKGVIYNILIQTDSNNSVGEWDEGNNNLQVSTPLLTRQPNNANCP
jgi:hypothetical protein